jgi:membrane associated rhomboid family serine protease
LLILPLHRSLNRSNFPLVTLLLILANIFVFAALQSGDARVYDQAMANYEQANLGDIEFPAHVTWLQEHGGDSRKIEAAQNAPAPVRLGLIESDQAFMVALHADHVIVPTNPAYTGWHQKRADFERIFDSAFSRSHELRFSHFEPGRVLWSMFMHGGMDHIFFNMLFLAILGMLVEGALGPWFFVGLYLAGGIAAALTTLAWHWGEEGRSLGASGAIAAVMGAFCVIWGLRKVRVFYWFFVVFDYKKVPALVLLPFWLIGLVLLPWLDPSSHTDFADHAGGILCGVALAFALRRQGVVRDHFVEEDERVEKHERSDATFDEALGHLGRLDIPKARSMLESIDRAEPGQLRVLVALYRCARYRGTPVELDAAAARVLGFAAPAEADKHELKTVYDDYLKACASSPRPAYDALLRLLAPWLRVGDDVVTEALLRSVAEREPHCASLPAAWFSLALGTPEGSPKRRARLEYLLQHYAQSDFAPKVQFLLSQC